MKIEPVIRILLLVVSFTLVSSICDENCSTCFNNVCLICLDNYELENGLCIRTGIGTGAVVGIVIGCLVGGAIVVFALLCLIVWCSETV